MIFGPWAKTEFFINGGYGFHSNDGRGATDTVDPNAVDPQTGRPIPSEGHPVGAGLWGRRSAHAPPLFRT